MDKSVLISIRPKWCNLICSGTKTIELRKSRPKLETPFTVYIYCTKDIFSKDKCIFNGKVIGEFTCDSIECFKYWNEDEVIDILSLSDSPLSKACLSTSEFFRYVGFNKKCYFWHISNLILYDFPVELSDFNCKIPPQSWCYVHGL